MALHKFLMVTCMMVTGVPTALLSPWRSFLNDIADTFLNTSLVLIVVLWASSVHRMSQSDRRASIDKARIWQLVLTILTFTGIACLGSYKAHGVLFSKREHELHNTSKAQLSSRLAKTVKLLYHVDVSVLEEFFDGIEESQWEHFGEAMSTLDLFLLSGMTGGGGKPKLYLKHHDSLDELSHRIITMNPQENIGAQQETVDTQALQNVCPHQDAALEEVNVMCTDELDSVLFRHL